MELMSEPVMVATGHTYDRMCIEKWLKQGNKTCPCTGSRLRHLELTPNYALRTAIQEWAHTHGVTLGPLQPPQASSSPSTKQTPPPSHSQRVPSYQGELLPALPPPSSQQQQQQRRTHGSSGVQQEQEGGGLLQGHEEIVWAVEAYDNRLVSASADKTIRVWDVPSRRCECVLEDHTRPVLSLAISNGRLFSGSYDYTIKVRHQASSLHKAL